MVDETAESMVIQMVGLMVAKRVAKRVDLMERRKA